MNGVLSRREVEKNEEKINHRQSKITQKTNDLNRMKTNIKKTENFTDLLRMSSDVLPTQKKEKNKHEIKYEN